MKELIPAIVFVCSLIFLSNPAPLFASDSEGVICQKLLSLGTQVSHEAMISLGCKTSGSSNQQSDIVASNVNSDQDLGIADIGVPLLVTNREQESTLFEPELKITYKYYSETLEP